MFHGASPVIIATAVWCLIHPQVELPVRTRVLFPLYRGGWLLHLFVCRFINEGRPVRIEHTTPQTMLIELRLVVTLTTLHPSLSVYSYQTMFIHTAHRIGWPHHSRRHDQEHTERSNVCKHTIPIEVGQVQWLYQYCHIWYAGGCWQTHIYVSNNRNFCL